MQLCWQKYPVFLWKNISSSNKQNKQIFKLAFIHLKYGFIIISWSRIPKNIISWFLEVGTPLATLATFQFLGEGFTILILSDLISNACKTLDQKLNALFRVSANMNSDKCSLLINSFIKSHFSYFPFIWMFCNRKSMKKVNKIIGRYLRLMINKYELYYKQLLDLANEISPNQRCLNSSMTEVYKCLNGLSLDILDILTMYLQFRNTGTILATITFPWLASPKLIHMAEIQFHRANQIWNLLPVEIKYSANFDSFKLEIQQWRCLECPCTLCKTYLTNLGC